MTNKLMRVIEIENESQLIKFLIEFSGGGGIGIEKENEMYFAVAFRGGERVIARLKPKIYETYFSKESRTIKDPISLKDPKTREVLGEMEEFLEKERGGFNVRTRNIKEIKIGGMKYRDIT